MENCCQSENIEPLRKLPYTKADHSSSILPTLAGSSSPGFQAGIFLALSVYSNGMCQSGLFTWLISIYHGISVVGISGYKKRPPPIMNYLDPGTSLHLRHALEGMSILVT